VTHGVSYETSPHFVYELYAADETCLYVGCSLNVGSRIQVHVARSWWAEVDRIEAKLYPDFATGRAAVKVRIGLLKPVHNMQ
jgi:predicted GIY-YIG superfamily endonuclease